MKKLKTSKLTAVLLAVSAIAGYTVVGHAQGRRYADGAVKSKGAPPNEAIVAYLSLTDTQLAAFEAIHANTRIAAEPVLEQIRTKREALHQARQDNNATAMANLQLEIDVLEEQLDELHADAQVQMVGSLTADQKAKLAALTGAADLFDEARQAAAMGLLTPPEGEGPRFAGGCGKGFGMGKMKGGPGPF